MSQRKRYTKTNILLHRPDSPDDFRVNEVIALPEGTLNLESPRDGFKAILEIYRDKILEYINSTKIFYLLLELEKYNLDIVSVVGKLSKLLNVKERRIIVPGTKDKRALTRSLIAIEVEKVSELERLIDWLSKLPKRVRLANGWFKIPRIIGISSQRPKSSWIQANYFEIKPPLQLTDALRKAVQLLRSVEIPNYFGEQRFGSLLSNPPEEGILFIPQLVLQRRYSEALQTLLTVPMEGDPREHRRFKRKLMEFFSKVSPRAPGALADLRLFLPKNTFYSSLASFLENRVLSETTAKKALDLINEKLVRLWVSALQSYIWNELIKRVIMKGFKPEELIWIRISRWAYPIGPRSDKLEGWREFNEYIRGTLGETLELPWKKVEYPPQIQPIFDEIMRELRIDTLKFQLRNWYTFPSKRPTLLRPEDLKVSPLKGGVKLSFKLPRGSYATLVLGALEGLLPAEGIQPNRNTAHRSERDL